LAETGLDGDTSAVGLVWSASLDECKNFVAPPTAGYFREMRAICDRYDVLLILDEVMAGMGRTGHLFACTEDGIGKRVTGYSRRHSVATMIVEEAPEVIEHATALLQHRNPRSKSIAVVPRR
jgi:adenosylmethionine-8-amino-7-oxononanoate aminotransferase